MIKRSLTAAAEKRRRALALTALYKRLSEALNERTTVTSELRSISTASSYVLHSRLVTGVHHVHSAGFPTKTYSTVDLAEQNGKWAELKEAHRRLSEEIDLARAEIRRLEAVVVEEYLPTQYT